VPEPESEVELSAIKSKRKASEVGFSIPPAKRPEPAEFSVTESESDSDASPSHHRASALAPAQGKGTAKVHNCDRTLCSPQRLVGYLRTPSPADDSVTESESDDGFPVEAVSDHL